MRPIEYTGEWWRVDDEENTEAGTLLFSPEKGIKLELIGAFTKALVDDPFSMFDSDYYPRIGHVLGVSTGGKYITLRNCQRVGANASSPGIPVETFRAESAIIGHQHLRSLKYSKIAVKYTYLLDWIGFSSFKSTWEHTDSEFPTEHLTVRPPNPVHAACRGAKIAIGGDFSPVTTLRSYNCTQDARLVIELPDALSIDEWLAQFVSPLQDLLSLATDRPNAITAMYVYPMPEDSDDEKQRAENEKRPLELFFQPSFHDNSAPKTILGPDILFLYKDLEIDFSSFLTKWLETASVLKTVRGLYLNTRYNPSQYLDAKFLSLAQAAELYHRERGKKRTIFTRPEFKKRLNAAVAGVPEEYKTWIKEALRYSNEPKLLERILELYDLAQDVLHHLYPDRQEFGTKVKNARNYYTHYSQSLRDKIPDPIELYYLTESLSYMLIRCFLSELGFSAASCLKFLERSSKFQNLKRELAKYRKNAASPSLPEVKRSKPPSPIGSQGA